MKKIFALFLIVITVCFIQTSSAQLNLAPDDHSVLILSPTVSGGAFSAEALAAAKAGIDNYGGVAYTIVLSPSWATFTAIDFASYRAIVVGDPTCGGSGFESAEATTNIWGPVVNASGGNVVMIGTDPVFHYSQGGDSVIYGCMRFVISDDPGKTKTGAYLCLSCYYNNYCVPTDVALLNGLESAGQNFSMTGGCSIGCYNNIHKTANHPALVNVTDAELGPWSCSVHEIFNDWDELNYDVLAIGLGLDSNYIAPDGTVGSPYILARGAAVISDITLTPEIDTNTVGDPHCLTATVVSGGVPVAGTPVTFTVIAGPCAGVIGVANTDNAGIAQICYTCNTPGTDFIVATFVSSPGVVQTSNTVRKVWEAPLPVEMTAFTSNINGRDVTLNWTTASEINNQSFDVERSAVDGQWSVVGNVAGNGTTTEQRNYSFVDRNVAAGTYNYRLKQIDFNGNFAYHALNNQVVIGIPEKFAVMQNYPNPFNPSTKIDFTLPNDGNVKITVYDNSGKLVSTITEGFRASGYYSVNFNASSLSSGIYYYKVEFNNGSESVFKVHKMLLVK